MNYDLIIARYGEVALKSNRVRRRFESRLVNNIKASIDAEVKVNQARIYIFPKEFDDDKIISSRYIFCCNCHEKVPQNELYFYFPENL